MSQQPHDMSYLDYASTPNRSPTSSRQSYAAFASGLTFPRQPQRPIDVHLGPSSLYSTDRTGTAYNPRVIDAMGGQGGVPSGYMLDNGQSWNYNSVGVATVNGASNGTGRQRTVNRRAALPQNWTDPSGVSMGNARLQPFPVSLNVGQGSNGGIRADHGQAHTSPDLRSVASDGDQLIPTAIVIKNIPFAVRKETLANIMLDLNLPQPYAFNYHFDNGVFRGLAFANFQSAEDTRVVIEAMNGMEVQGRKLRVEYKKMLPEAERERIEREKRERRGQLEEQHRAPMLHQQSSVQSLGGMSQTQQRVPSSHLGDVDLNNPQTLDSYTELVMFKRDDSREALVFPPHISPEHRRSIHIMAHHLGLEHQSMGEADSRQLTVLKRRQPSPTANVQNVFANSLDAHKRGLSRAATFDFAADRESRGVGNNYSHVQGRQGPTLELPGSPDGSNLPNNLRTAKSFADLRSFTPSPSQASSSYLGAGPGPGPGPGPGTGMGNIAPGSAARFGEYVGSVGGSGNSGGKVDIISGLGGLTLSPYDSSALPSQTRITPGAIGSQRSSANNYKQGAPERQPRGPEWEVSAGFAARGRSNGHMQRGSDSSDNGARAAANSTSATRYL